MPNYEYSNSLHDMYQILNIVISGITVENVCVCRCNQGCLTKIYLIYSQKNINYIWGMDKNTSIMRPEHERAHLCIIFLSWTFEGIRSTECAVSTAGISQGKRATRTRAASSVETLWGWPQLCGNTPPREHTQSEGFYVHMWQSSSHTHTHTFAHDRSKLQFRPL